jgi:hypothetical protein
MSYPKWVKRGYGIGDVLCLNAEEEAAIHADTAARAIGEVTELTAAINREYEEAQPVARKKPGPKPKAK